MNLAMLKQRAVAGLCILCMLCGLIMVNAQAEVVAAPLQKAASAQNGMVRVYLMSIASKTTLNVTVNGSYSINGNVNQALNSGEKITVALNTSNGNITMTRNGSSVNMGQKFALRRHSASQAGGVIVAESLNAANPYPGDMTFVAQMQSGVYKLYCIANVFIEDYLYGVVPYEMGNSAHIEALKAQAVAARTYTLSKMRQRSGSLYDVVDNTNDQVYRGTPSGDANCKAAVDATRGIVSMSGSSLVETYYTASNGGQTESCANAWGSARSYLIVKDDPFDLANTDAVVKSVTVYGDYQNASQNAALKSILNGKLGAALTAKGYKSTNASIEKITSVVPHTPKYASPSKLYTYVDFFVTANAYNSSGKAVSVALQLTCSIFNELEGALSMGINGSANEMWSVTKSGSNFVLRARRFGHGIGLSQRGAMQMGRQGYNYADILGFYYHGSKRMQYSFTNTILSPISSGKATDIITEVDPAELEGEDAPCTATVDLVNNQGVLGIYNAAATTAKVIGGVPDGAPVRVYAIKNDWCFISYGQVYGYVQKSGLSINGTAPTETSLKPSSVTEYAIVTSNGYLNLRQSPSTSSTALGTAPSGAVLSVFSKENGWAYIQYGTITAYASTAYLTMYSSYPTAISDPTQNVAKVSLSNASETVNMRATASLSGAVMMTLKHDTQVSLIKDDGTWSQVTYQGQTGYIMSSYLVTSGSEAPAQTTPEAPSATLKAIMKQASAVYKDADETSASLGEVASGKAVTVLEYGLTYCQIQYGELTGYVKTALLNFSGEGEEPVPQTGEYATVTTQSGSLNLRSKDSAGSSILCTIPRLKKIEVLAYGDTWTKVTYNGYVGYVMTMYLTMESAALPDSTPAPAPEPVDGTVLTATVTTQSGSLNLRSEANANAQILTTIPRNKQITVYTRGNDWCHVLYNGISGYVMSSFLTFMEEQAPIPEPEPDEEENTEPTPTPAETDKEQDPNAVYAMVTTASGSLNLRETMSQYAKVLVCIPRNTVLQLFEQYDGWSRVTYRGFDGFVMNQFLTIVDEPDRLPSNETSQSAYVSTASGGLNLRTGPIAANNIILSIPRNATVTVYEKGVKWCYIAYNGTRGYVMTQYLTFGEAVQQESKSVEESKAYVSTPNGGSLNVRKAPNGEVIGSISNGKEVTVCALADGWSYIRFQGSYGYVMTMYLVVEQAAPQSQTTQQTDQTPLPIEEETEEELEEEPEDEIEEEQDVLIDTQEEIDVE